MEERARTDRVHREVEWQDLDADVGPPGGIEQALQLFVHDLRLTMPAEQDRFVEDHPDGHGGVFAEEDLLPDHPCLHAGFDPRRRHDGALAAGIYDLPRVLLGLQEARHDLWFPRAYLGRLRLKAQIG